MRKGMGRGLGKGYRNMINVYDSHVHSLSAKGVSQKATLLPIVNDMEEPMYNFGSIPTYKKKGLIREIAKKVHEGVDWAVAWEKEHLPKQQAWVKKEYAEAKALAKKGYDKVKELAEHKKEDMDDVRDELDIDNDGTQDISIEELEDVNVGIRTDLEDIDLDNDNVPDYVDTEAPLDVTYAETIDEPESEVKKDSFFPTFRDRAKEAYTKGKTFVQGQLEKQKEQKEELMSLTASQLKEKAIRDRGESFFGGNKYKEELLRRVKAKIDIEKNIAITQKKELAQKKEGGSLAGFDLGFLSPL